MSQDLGKHEFHMMTHNDQSNLLHDHVSTPSTISAAVRSVSASSPNPSTPSHIRLAPEPRHLPLSVIAMSLLRRSDRILLADCSVQHAPRLAIPQRIQRLHRPIRSSSPRVSSTSPAANIAAHR